MIKQSFREQSHAIDRQVIDAGDYYLARLEDGQTLRIVDLKGNQAADTLFYSADDPGEHYSAVNTMRNQKNLYLTAGTDLMSSENRVMLSIVADTCGRHDTLGGACSTESNTVRYAIDKQHMHAWKNAACMLVGTVGCWHWPSILNTESPSVISRTTSTSS